MPSATQDATVHLPVIDISSSNSQAASQLLDAAVTYGFVFVENNDAGIRPGDIQSMFDLSREFFACPTSIKEECSINSAKSGKNKGWLAMHTETLDPTKQKKGDFKEAFNIGEYENGLAQQPLSGPLEARNEQIGNFFSSCHALSNRILRLFAVGLELEDSWFSDRHDRSKGASGSVLRLLYYPSISGLGFGEDDLGAGQHSDYGSVTLLFQLPGQPGLEILTSEGTWAAVPADPLHSRDQSSERSQATPLPILVNIGDLLSYWTNGLLKSTVHRVTRKGVDERYSMAYFCHPLDHAELVPVPSKAVQQHADGTGQAGETMTAKDHLNSRLAATYGLKQPLDNLAA